ncbi:kinase-like domain-containing protein, partial [Rhizophagus irregularis DAOM 181602=DAOM 197198]
MINLAICYYNGEGIEKNLEKVFYWYQIAAEKGHINAMTGLAKCYYNGEGTEKHLEKAFYWYQKAAENGNEVAMNNLAICYENGKGTERNLEKAFCWYQKAAENGNTEAIFNLAICYKDGNGTEKNLEKAFYCYQKAVENGDKEAQFYLGVCYEEEIGIEKDEFKATYWYQKSAQQGFSNAKYKLGFFYKIGKGVKEVLKNPFKKVEKGSLGANKWIENALKHEKVKLISYKESKNAEPLDAGSFGIISKAIWTKTNNYVVCKKLTNTTHIKNDLLDAFIHELKMHMYLDYSERIIRCFGISLDPKTNEYLLIMQYADGGELQNYLKNNFRNLTWNDKKKLAFQIADGLNYLHYENIFHRDLVNFGISKNQNNQTSAYIGNFGVVAYMGPEHLKNPESSSPYTKSSDIYSFGVLMWEISSGHPPFEHFDDKWALAYSIVNNNNREKLVPNTPEKYEKLYTKCWSQEPRLRPTINEILDEFEGMDFGNDIGNLISESQTSTESLEQHQFISNLI